MIHSYPSIYQIGHRMIADIFKGEVVIEEKVDGSQFSFGVIDGELMCRSKGKQLILDAPEKMFQKAVDYVRSIAPALPWGWTFRGEYLSTPKHNTLAYSRIPANNIVIFDINTDIETYMTYEQKAEVAYNLGFETVPIFFQGMVEDFAQLQEFLQVPSFLGGVKVEGFVVKNYDLFTQEKKVAMGKYVSEAFKEVHQKDWKERNPTGKDIETALIEMYRSDARWSKAIQHLKEQGLLEGSAKDIGLLIREVPQDILKECEEDIKERLFKHFWPKISRGVVSGLPEFYKELLAKSAFEE